MSLRGHYFRVTEQAALAALRKPDAARRIDGPAVTAMRHALNDVAFRGRAVMVKEQLTMRRCCGLAKRWQRRWARSRYRGLPD
ncbi:hypothetical protein ACNKHL_17685 [Shigella flexneri]